MFDLLHNHIKNINTQHQFHLMISTTSINVHNYTIDPDRGLMTTKTYTNSADTLISFMQQCLLMPHLTISYIQ